MLGTKLIDILAARAKLNVCSMVGYMQYHFLKGYVFGGIMFYKIPVTLVNKPLAVAKHG